MIHGNKYEIMPDDEFLLEHAIAIYENVPFDDYVQFIEKQLNIKGLYIGLGPKIKDYEIVS